MEFETRRNYRTGIGPTLQPVGFRDFGGLRPLCQEVWILTTPHLVLRAEAEAQRPKDKSAAERVLADVAAVAAIARRARRVLAAQPGWAATWWPRGELGAAVAAAHADTTALFTLVRQEMADVGRAHADGDSAAS